jgi:PAS domain S-box-containing protein
VGPLTLLVVEPDADVAAELAARLERHIANATAEIAHTSEDALAVLDSTTVDCLVTECDLPDAAFEQFLDALRAVTPRLPVVVTTAWPFEDVGVDPSEVTDVRPKPTGDGEYALFATRIEHAITAAAKRTVGVRPDLDQLFADHALPMLLIEPDTGHIAAANDAAVSFYGYTRRELTKMRIQDINTLDDETVERRREEATTNEGTHFVFEHQLHSGETRTVEVNSAPIEYENGTYLFSIIQDVTERLEAEARLQEANERYQRLTEGNIVGIYTIEDRTFTYVNPRLAEIFGTTVAEMLGSSVSDYVAEDDRALVQKKLAARERGPTRASHYTFTGLRADGEERTVEVYGGRVETSEGVTIVGTMLDVTERERQERDLRRLSRALEYAAPAVYVTDDEGVIEYVNPAFERITGYDESEALGSTPRILRSGRMDDSYYDRLYETLAAGDVWEEAITNQRNSGELYYAYQTIAPYLDERGDLEGYVAIQSDVTDERIRQQVVQVFQRIFRHNLRNKLSIIQGNAELLESELDEEDREAYVAGIRDAADDLDELSEKVAIVSRAVDPAETPRPTDLVRVVEQQKERLEREHPDARIRVGAPDEVVVSGGGSLDVAVYELLENAIVHNDRDEPVVNVELRTDRDESMVELVISDTGPGLSDVELNTLTVGEETPLQHTTGIGLWLVEWLVTSLGGDLELADNEPRGLRVRVHLPFRESDSSV